MTRWGRLGLAVCFSVFVSGAGTTAKAEFMTFDVTPAFAPARPDAASWNAYVVNANYGILNAVDAGDRETDPAAYQRVTEPIPPQELIYTTGFGAGGVAFNSWRGVAAPNSVPFPGEFGNRIHFGLLLMSDMSFQLADLTWELDSNDADNYFDQSGDFIGDDYSSTRYGIWWGADGEKGGGDDVTRTGGPGTDPINELIYVGVGDGFLSDEPNVLTDQESIDVTIADILAGCSDPDGCLIDVTATYTLPDGVGGFVSSSGTFVLETPEPSSAVLGLIGIAAVIAGSRRRR